MPVLSPSGRHKIKRCFSRKYSMFWWFKRLWEVATHLEEQLTSTQCLYTSKKLVCRSKVWGAARLWVWPDTTLRSNAWYCAWTDTPAEASTSTTERACLEWGTMTSATCTTAMTSLWTQAKFCRRKVGIFTSLKVFTWYVRRIADVSANERVLGVHSLL